MVELEQENCSHVLPVLGLQFHFSAHSSFQIGLCSDRDPGGKKILHANKGFNNHQYFLSQVMSTVDFSAGHNYIGCCRSWCELGPEISFFSMSTEGRGKQLRMEEGTLSKTKDKLQTWMPLCTVDSCVLTLRKTKSCQQVLVSPMGNTSRPFLCSKKYLTSDETLWFR